MGDANNDNPLATSGAGPAIDFINTHHHDVQPIIDPANVTLPKSFVVAIIGASRGIGAGVAYAYAKAGASGLVLASRRISGLEETAAGVKKINSNIETEIISCDITSDASVKDLASKIQSRFGRLDVLVINSGAAAPVGIPLTEMDSDLYTNITMVNYVGSFYAVKHITPLLLATADGAKAIVAVNSLAAFMVRGFVAQAPYGISKAAQLRVMEMAHDEYHGKQGLVTYSLHPGAVLTEMSTGATPEEFYGLFQDSPDLCGAVAVYLTKDKSHAWLSGRFIDATWDIEALEAKKEEVVKNDLLKLTLDV
jgi:NAD(P)-dependent dehydrogenase (short-subunit alcohol dehydrogenase family)